MLTLTKLVEGPCLFALTASAIAAPSSSTAGPAPLEARQAIGPRCIYDDSLPAFHYVIALDKNAPGVGTDCGLACQFPPSTQPRRPRAPRP